MGSLINEILRPHRKIQTTEFARYTILHVFISTNVCAC